MPASVLGICNSMFYGLVTNGNWMLNSFCMILVVGTTLIYYEVLYSFTDVITFILMGNTLIFIAITLYTMEKKDKKEFLAYKQII
jgi:hypothetical protein